MATFVPQTVRPHAVDSGVLPRRSGQSKDPFYLTLNPLQWDWHEVRGWVPAVGRLYITPGVMGTPTPERKGDPVNPSPAILAVERFQSVVIKDQETYLRRLPRQGGWCYFTRWDTPDVYHGEVSWEFDADGYMDFIASHVGTAPGKLIKPPPKRLKERKIATHGARLSRLERLHHDNPRDGGIRRRYLAALLQDRQMRAELEGRPFDRASLEEDGVDLTGAGDTMEPESRPKPARQPRGAAKRKDATDAKAPMSSAATGTDGDDSTNDAREEGAANG